MVVGGWGTNLPTTSLLLRLPAFLCAHIFIERERERHLGTRQALYNTGKRLQNFATCRSYILVSFQQITLCCTSIVWEK